MSYSKQKIAFPHISPPVPGTVTEVFEGVYWAQMQLPMVIDHVNVYILEGATDLTIVDTGLNVVKCKSAWLNIIENYFSTKPVKNVVITHHLSLIHI